jgi:hypothetical protein
MPPQDENITKANIEAPTSIPVVLDIMVFVLKCVIGLSGKYRNLRYAARGNFASDLGRI